MPARTANAALKRCAVPCLVGFGDIFDNTPELVYAVPAK